MKMYKIPWKLVQNKLLYYPGGREIDRFRGVNPPKDDNCPECWVGSDIHMRYAVEHGEPTKGYAQVILPDGTECFLYEALRKEPEKALGPERVKAEGGSLGVLVKLLDAQRQLGLQAHPTRPYAKEVFHSDFGKEESWYVIGLRDDSPETPYVLMGFKEGITREQFEEAYLREDIHAMEQMCHKVPARMGDVFFISGGLPHAIGCGVFVVEVQEPSDITVGAEPVRHLQGAEKKAYQDAVMGCFEYEGHDMEENLRRHRIEPRIIREGSWGKETLLIGPEQTRYFSFTRLDVTGKARLLDPRAPQVGIVLAADAGGRAEAEEGRRVLSAVRLP